MTGSIGQADLKKVKAAAAVHAKRRRNWQLQYSLWAGGSLGSCVLGLAVMAINPERGPYQTPVNDPGLITHANRNAKTWRAGACSFFKGWTLGDARLLKGISVSAMGNTAPACMLPEASVPESFDARERWPQCFRTPVYHMGNCTASWAIAAASALSDRFCISNPPEYSNLALSPQQLLSCDTANRGCSGGDIDTVWNFIKHKGLVSERCFPYEADSTVSCLARCHNEAPMKAAGHCVLTSEALIRREVYLNGPVVAPIFLSDDFLVYRRGLYQEMATAKQLADHQKQRIIHAVKIIGWGSLEGKRYWLIENSFGEDWGERGFARLAGGGDPNRHESVVVESYVLAGTPASRKLDPFDDSDGDSEGDLESDGPHADAFDDHDALSESELSGDA